MEYREEDEEGSITATNFNYHTVGGEFNAEYISTACGRLDSTD